MDKIKAIVNHPLSKAVTCGIAGVVLLLEGHSLYSGILFGLGLREMLLAFKAD